MAKNNYLERRGNNWLARYSIHEPYRPYFGGKRFFSRTTGTSDYRLAVIRLNEFQVGWRTAIMVASDAINEGLRPNQITINQDGTSERLASSGFAMIGSNEDDTYSETSESQMAWDEYTADDPLLEGVIDSEPVPALIKPERSKKYLYDHINGWLKDRIGDNPKTQHQKRRVCEEFYSVHKSADDLTIKNIDKYIIKMAKGGYALNTVKYNLSQIRTYAKWLSKNGHISRDNYADILAGEIDEAYFKEDQLPCPFLHFTDTQIKQFLDLTIEADPQLYQLIMLGIYTGGRIEELCQIDVETVLIEDDVLFLPGTKTRLSKRWIPIHAEIRDIITSIKGRRKSGFLFQHLNADQFGDRSHAPGCRFGTLKSELGFKAKKHVFHSFRGCFSQRLTDTEGVDTTIVQALLGHTGRSTMVKHYSHSPSEDAKRRVINKLHYNLT